MPRAQPSKPKPTPATGATPPPPAPPDATRLRLIEAAGPVFARRGFVDATVREIVGEAKANIAAVNYHFGDKLGLYRAVLEHYSHGAMAAHPVTPPAPHAEAAADRLGFFIAAFLERLFHDGKPAWMSQIISREMVAPTAAFQHLAETHMRPQLETLRGIVAELMGLPTSDQRVHRSASSVIAQCVTYKQCGAAHCILTPTQTYDAKGRAQLAAHITAFSLAGIAALSGTKTVSAAKTRAAKPAGPAKRGQL